MQRTGIVNAWVAFVGLLLGSAAAGDMDNIPVELTRRRIQAPEERLDSVKAFIVVRSVQPKLDDGLRFSVLISNEGAEPVELHDPTELVDLLLVDEQRGICALPPVPPLFQVMTGDPAGTRAGLDARRPYVIEREARDEEGVKTIRDVKDGLVSLQPGETFRMDARIEKIVAEAREYRRARRQWGQEVTPSSPHYKGKDVPRPVPTIIPIVPGKYETEIDVHVLSRSGGSHVFRSERIPVQLGPPRDPEE